MKIEDMWCFEAMQEESARRKLPLWNALRQVFREKQNPLQKKSLLELLLRGRRSTLTIWKIVAGAWSPVGPGCICAAGAALCASGPTFAWQAQHFDYLEDVAGAWSPVGRGCICVAGAALCASGATFAWEAHHFDSLEDRGGRLVRIPNIKRGSSQGGLSQERFWILLKKKRKEKEKKRKNKKK